MRKKNRWTIWNWVCYTGLPWLGIFIFAGIKIKSWFYLNRYHRVFEITGKKDIQDILVYSFLLWLIVFLKNGIWANSDKKIGLLTWMEPYRYIPPKISPRKVEAMHPPVDEEYLSNVPDGLPLGRYKDKYVRFPIAKNHALSSIILGTPGSGKSVLLLTMLIYQLHFFKFDKKHPEKEKQVFFLIDCKPELRRKASYKWDKSIRELSISDRSQYGWDPYYCLSPDTPDDDVISHINTIAEALIECTNPKNEFFYHSAQTIFKYAAFNEYKKGHTFMKSMDNILEYDITAYLKGLLKNAEGKVDLMKIKKGLSAYSGKQKSECFQSIEMTLRGNMEIFLKDDVRFFMETNPRKVSPLTLEDRISIAFTLKSFDIKEYKAILRMVVMQLLQHCEARDEDNSHLITLVIDEAFKLGVIRWVDFLAVCRSKQVSCILAFQSLSQMQTVWSREEATSLVEVVSAVAVLSCTDPSTQKMICDWTGTYHELQISTNKSAGKYNTYTESYSEKKILEPQDLMRLKRSGEVVLFLDGEYYCVNTTGARYYRIPKFEAISKKCKQSYKED